MKSNGKWSLLVLDLSALYKLYISDSARTTSKFGQRSYNVEVHEYRSDPRTEDNVAGRSINLALSKRGREALKAVGAEEHVVRTGIPMHARMIHSHDGKQTPIPYGKKGQYILSIDRRALNEHLISLVEKHPNVKFHFDSKCVDANLGDFPTEEGGRRRICREGRFGGWL